MTGASSVPYICRVAGMVDTRAADRRRLIADAAIALISRDGIRALTHRAVDAEAGLPTGSTSSYVRTRSALLELVVDHLELRAIADTGAVADAAATAPLTLDEATDAVCGLVDHLAARRADMRTRYALMLELDDPALRNRLTDKGPVHDRSVDIATDLLSRAGLPAARADVEALIELTDALVAGRTITDRPSVHTRRIIGAFLARAFGH